MADKSESEEDEVCISESSRETSYKELEIALDNLLYDSHTLAHKCALYKTQLVEAEEENKNLSLMWRDSKIPTIVYNNLI